MWGEVCKKTVPAKENGKWKGLRGLSPKLRKYLNLRINAQATAHITFKLFKRALQVA